MRHYGKSDYLGWYYENYTEHFFEGKAWNVPCAELDVQMMQNKFRFTNIARDEETGEVLLRVLADLYVFGKTSSAS